MRVLGMKERVALTADSLTIESPKVKAPLFECEFPFHFRRMEKSRNGQTKNSHSR